MLVASFYSFFPIEESQLKQRRSELETLAAELGVRGLVILATEGINSTLSGTEESIKKFCERVEQWIHEVRPEQSFPMVKYAPADRHTFRKFLVKIRPEIVTTSSPDISPLSYTPNRRTHLSPKEWHDLLTSPNEDFVLVDTRNWYETKIGTFKGAVDPKISEFTEFKDFFESQGIPKDKKVLIFCTGGIRCEKGILELEKAGYNNVYQLEGGILNYLKEFPDGEFQGECFVFDQRVAVQPSLEATKTYKLCPHCGQPAKEEITCVRCDHTTKICENCASENSVKSLTCSKNCAHHWGVRPGQKGPRQQRVY